MKPMELVAADSSHIDYLAANMREADVIECEAAGHSPKRALEGALRCSYWSLTAINDNPQAMLGVGSLNMITGEGIPWMLGTEVIYDNPRLIVQWAPRVIGLMLNTFDALENLCSSDNSRALSFLKHVGFEVSPEEQEIGGVNFVRFRYVRPSISVDCGRDGYHDGRPTGEWDGSGTVGRLRSQGGAAK
jgi:hypothetical protein